MQNDHGSQPCGTEGGDQRSLRAERPRSPALTKTLELLLLLLAVVLTTAVAEWGARRALADITTTGDNGSWFANRWRHEHPPIENRLGFRDKDFSPIPVAGTYRIAVIGDSFTYGQGIPRADRLTDLLEDRLNERGDRATYEVLNFGRSGADTPDELDILSVVLQKAHPDFILLQWYINDVRGGERETEHLLVPWSRLHRRLMAHSVLYYLIDQQWLDLQARMGWIETEDEFYLRLFKDAQGPGAREAQAALEAFLERCRNARVPVGIVLFPKSRGSSDEPDLLGFLLDRVLATCSRRGIRCVDLRPTFANEDPSRLIVNRFDGHPDRLANQLATDAVLRSFENTWAAAADSPSNAGRARGRQLTRAAAQKALDPAAGLKRPLDRSRLRRSEQSP